MKRLISILLTVVMLFSMLVAAIPASAATVATEDTDKPLKFKSGLDNLWFTEKQMTALPKTIEATINVPTTRFDIYEGHILAWKGRTNNSGHIIWVDLLRKNASNGDDGNNLGIRVLIKNGTTETTKVYYDALNSHLGEKVHIAFTFDSDVKLYINGELYTGGSFLTNNSVTNDAKFMEVYNSIDASKLTPLSLAGDDRLADSTSNLTKVDNYRYFKGGVYNACVFSDVRSASEVKADAKKLDTSKADNLIMAYDTTNMESTDRNISDLSGNGYDLKRTFHGKAFTSGLDNVYSTDKKVTALPKTFEATIAVPDIAAGKKLTYEGEIFAFYNDATKTKIWVDILRRKTDNTADDMNNLGIRLLCNNGTNEATKVYADALNSYLGQTIHVAFTVDDTSVKLYINGVERSDETGCYWAGVATNDASFINVYNGVDASKLPCLSIGGDDRKADPNWPGITDFDNYRYFKGRVFSACVFSDVRSAAEIASDKATHPTNDANLLMSYDFAEESSTRVVYDKSGNGYDLSAYYKWLDADDREEMTGYAYSFAVVGDTQVITRDETVKMQDANTVNGTYSAEYAGNFAKIYDWLLANQKSKNIQFSFHMGDVTDWSHHTEWQLAMENITRMNGKIPNNIVRGNHDNATTMSQYYTTKIYKNSVTTGEEYGFFDGRGIEGYNENALNAYQTITVGNVMYLMLSLDMGPCKAVVEWANEVIEAHPYHNVIITTHSYLQGDSSVGHENYPYMDAPKDCSATQYNPGGYYGKGGEYGVDWDSRLQQHKNAGEAYLHQDASYMLNNLVKKHSNISMVICGHECSEYVRQISTTGDAGNTVLQFLVDGQLVDRQLQAAGEGHAGLVAMFYFSEDGKTVTTEYYSTIRNQYLHNDSNTTYLVNTVSVPEEVSQFYTMMHALNPGNYSSSDWITISAKLEETKQIMLTSSSSAERKAAVVSLHEEVCETLEYSSLDTAINNAKALSENDYSAEDWAEIQAVLKSAQDVRNNAYTQREINSAKSNLNDSLKEKKKLDRSLLSEAIAKAEKLVKGEYTEGTWNILSAVLDMAKEALTVRTQSIADATAKALNAAIGGLQKLSAEEAPPPEDTSGGNDASTDGAADSATEPDVKDTSNEATPTDEEESGCGGTITAGTVVLCTVLTLGVGLRKKKD